jgi:hypothetical protein
MKAETRSALRYAVPAGLVSLLLSPLMAVWALVLGGAVAVIAAFVHSRSRGRASRIVLFVALGVFAGALPYIVAGLVMSALDSGAPSSGSGGG